eukprot:scaffold233435_cov21-Tisochrysis_lutea.AAC.1
MNLVVLLASIESCAASGLRVVRVEVGCGAAVEQTCLVAALASFQPRTDEHALHPYEGRWPFGSRHEQLEDPFVFLSGRWLLHVDTEEEVWIGQILIGIRALVAVVFAKPVLPQGESSLVLHSVGGQARASLLATTLFLEEAAFRRGGRSPEMIEEEESLHPKVDRPPRRPTRAGSEEQQQQHPWRHRRAAVGRGADAL